MENLTVEQKNIEWFRACHIESLPEDGGACVKYKDRQIALFNFKRRGELYATENLCPHKLQMALSRGMIGEAKGEPKVACPFHKKTFSLETGKCMDDEQYAIKTYPVKEEDGTIFIGIES